MKDDYDITLLAAPWQRAIDATKTGVAFAVLPPYSNPKKKALVIPGLIQVCETPRFVNC